MKYSCSGCKKLIASEDRRRKGPSLTALGGAVLDLRVNEAPKVKCSCGKTMILLKGSL